MSVSIYQSQEIRPFITDRFFPKSISGINIRSLDCPVGVVQDRSCRARGHVMLILGMDIDDNGTGLQEEILQLTSVIWIGIDIFRNRGIQVHAGRGRDAGMKLEGPVFDRRPGNDLVFVPIVLQDKFRPVFDTLNGTLDGAVFGLGLASIKAYKKP